MKIDLGNFGYAVPERGPTVRVPEDMGSQTGRAVEGLGAVGLNATANIINAREAEEERQRRIAEAEAKQQKAERDRAVAAEAHATFQNDIALAADEIRTGILDGTIRGDEAQKAYAERATKIREALLERVSPEHRQLVGAGFIRPQGMGAQHLNEAIRLRGKQEEVAAVDGTLEQLQRLAVRDPEGAIRQANVLLDTKGAAVYGPDKVAARKQAFAENALALNAGQRILEASNNFGALTKLNKELASDRYANMDPQRRMALQGQVENALIRLENRAQAAEQRRLAGLSAAWQGVIAVAQSPGGKVDLAGLNALVTASKGTPFEAAGAAMLADINFFSNFSSAPPGAQADQINKAAAAVQQQGIMDPAPLQRIEKMRKIHAETLELVSNDPQTYSQRTGRAPAAPLDLSEQGLKTLPSQIAERLRVARGMQKEYGSPLYVFTGEEATSLNKILEKVGPEQKAGFLKMVERGIGDSAAAADTMKQLAAKGATIAGRAGYVGTRVGLVTDGSWGSGPAVTVSGEKAAALLLKGEALLKGGEGAPKLKLPSEKSLDQQFEADTQGIFNGRGLARQQFLDYTMKYYAALSDEAGQFSDQIDSERWRKALSLATGGIGTRGGKKFILPYGVSRAQFDEAFWPEYQKAFNAGLADVPPAVAKNLPLDAAGDGKYYIKNGTDYVRAKAGGAPLVIDLSRLGSAYVTPAPPVLAPQPAPEPAAPVVVPSAKKPRRQ